MSTTGELLKAYRAYLDRLDVLDAEKSAINKMVAGIERELQDAMKAAGLEQVKGEGITVSVSDKWRARYDPEKWSDIVKWCAEQGRTDLVQRRLSDAKIMELVEAGVALPEGLSVEAHSTLSFRRVG